MVVLSVIVLVVAIVGLFEPLQKLLAPVSPQQVEAPESRQESRPPEMATIQAEIDTLLVRWGYAHGLLNPTSGFIIGYQIAGDFPKKDRRNELAKRMSRLSEELRLEVIAGENTVLILWRNEPLFKLLFVPPPAVPLQRVKVQVAIIVDDLGRDLAVSERLLGIDAAITFSVLPGEAHAREVAEHAHQRGREVLIHLPMEPEGYPEVNPGNDALLVAQSAEETRIRFNNFRQRVPHAVGGNNHMGSRFTADRQGMRRILGLMREDGMFFIDSRTTPASVAMLEARNLGMAVAGRDVFLDNDADVAKITAQVEKLVKLAQRRGQAIGICHPHAETLKALEQVLPRLRRRGIEVVPVSLLLDAGERVK